MLYNLPSRFPVCLYLSSRDRLLPNCTHIFSHGQPELCRLCGPECVIHEKTFYGTVLVSKTTVA